MILQVHDISTVTNISCIKLKSLATTSHNTNRKKYWFITKSLSLLDGTISNPSGVSFGGTSSLPSVSKM
jgi:hypothetical protein